MVEILEILKSLQILLNTSDMKFVP
jgi:hypothetical protein